MRLDNKYITAQIKKVKAYRKKLDERYGGIHPREHKEDAGGHKKRDTAA